jgi:hypothetical protein
MMNDPIINIDKVNLSLPPGFELRANNIGRLFAEQLSRLPITTSLSIERLSIPPLHIQPGETDTIIAQRIAHTVHSQLLSPTSRGKK